MKLNNCSECSSLRESDEKDFKIGYPKECKHICSRTTKWIEDINIVDEVCPLLGYNDLIKYTQPYKDMCDYSGQIYYNFTKEKLSKFIEYIINSNK